MINKSLMKIYLVLRISCIIFWHYHMGTFNLFAMKNRCRFFSSCLHVFQTDWQNIGGVSKEIFNEVNEYCLDLEAYMIINNKAKCNAKHFEPCYSGFFFFFLQYVDGFNKYICIHFRICFYFRSFRSCLNGLLLY